MADAIPSEVRLIESKTSYKGFFRIDVLTLQFRRFCGEWSATITREMFARGNSVAVLPYDPVRDEVILIRQFLPGAWAAGRPCFPLQIIAGTIGQDETPEHVAVREAQEEAGCALGSIVKAMSFLPSPGGSSELIHVFVARTDASLASGIHGLAAEHEDIRVEVYSADEALRMLDAGEIEAGPAVVGLLWFARMRGALRQAWLAQEKP
jgi:ADP-ribose pyrophosphatase